MIPPIDQPDENIRVSKGFLSKQNYEYNFFEAIKKFKHKSLNILHYKFFSNYFSKKFYDNYLPPKYLKFSQHQSTQSVKANLGDDLWKNYFKFTVVRNPIDQIVSNYFYIIKNSDQFKVFKNLSFYR